MTAEVETDEPIPSWLRHALLYAIREVASKSDPVRAGDYAGVDPDRVRRAIDRADGIFAAHRCHGDDDVIDVALAQAALMVARAMIRLRTRETHGR